MTLHKPSLAVWAPAPKAAATEVDALFPRADWTSTYPGHGEIYSRAHGPGSGANRGQYAVDFMVSNRALGDRIAAYLWANRKRLGIRYVIWFRRIISETGRAPGQWLPYVNPVPSKRGTASGDHTNHPHASFYSDATYTPPSGTTSPASPGMEDRYMDRINLHDTLGQALALGENALKLNKDGDLSVVSTPAKDVDVTVTVDVRGPDGKAASPSLYALTFRTVSYAKGTTTLDASTPAGVKAGARDELTVLGSSQARYAGSVGSVPDPRSLRLRVVVTALAEGLVLQGYSIAGWRA